MQQEAGDGPQELPPEIRPRPRRRGSEVAASRKRAVQVPPAYLPLHALILVQGGTEGHPQQRGVSARQVRCETAADGVTASCRITPSPAVAAWRPGFRCGAQWSLTVTLRIRRLNAVDVSNLLQTGVYTPMTADLRSKPGVQGSTPDPRLPPHCDTGAGADGQQQAVRPVPGREGHLRVRD